MALTDNLVAYYTFDSDQTTDSLGSFNLTKTGTVNAATGILSNGCDFTGNSVTNRLSTADSATWDFAAMSIQVWVKLSSISSTQSFVSKWWDGSQRAWDLGWENTANGFNVDIATNASNTDHQAKTGLSGFTTGVWYHVVATYDGTTIKIYANATVGGTTASLTGTTGGNTADVIIGTQPRNSSPTSSFLFPTNGIIDEVGIWSRALSSTEITQLYNGGSGLAYPFSGGATGPAAMKTANGLAKASVKTMNGLAIASVKTADGLA